MKESEFTQQEEQMIQAAFEQLLDDYAHTLHHQKVELITRAFHFANQAHHGVRRLSGEPYIMHPLAVARIVVKEIGLGSTSICSALLHDVVEDTDYTTDDIRNLFGDKIAQIVDGLTKISGGVFGDYASEQAENFRKLLLTMSDDIRVVLIKIADRLHNMRTLGAQPKEKQYKIAGETQYIYAPLAHRLGLFPIKTELEDLSFKYEHPDKYNELDQKIKNIEADQLESFERFAEPIRRKLQGMGYEFSLTARIKSIYSIYKKMVTKNIPFEDVYDLLAVRIIFTPNESMSEKDQCWMIYSGITEIYRPHPERIRDWISTPKANGYEALHLTVMAGNGQWVEVQIRTRRMHELAERGLAAHWKYKTGETEESELDKWLRNIKEILDHPEQNAMEFLGTFKLNLFAQEVFVFTPTGEIKTLPQGATALDFAYYLHSELGEHCIGAKVNHNLVPLSYVLQSGDQVEILTSTSQHPQEDWLTFTTTAKAQAGLRNYFRREERAHIRNGEKLFADAIDMLGVQEHQRDTALQRTLNHYQLVFPHDLYLQIGRGTIRLDNLQQVLFPKKSIWERFNPFGSSKNKVTYAETQPTDTPASTNNPQEKPKKKKAKDTIILADENIGKKYVMATCCHPIPGDEVLGYMDEGGQMHIHKIDCEQAQLLKSSQGKRIYAAEWNMHHTISFSETIELRGIDKFGVFIRILTIITSEYHLNIRRINISSDDGIFYGTIEMLVFHRDELNRLLKQIKQIPEVEVAKAVSQWESDKMDN